MAAYSSLQGRVGIETLLKGRFVSKSTQSSRVCLVGIKLYFVMPKPG